ncbi:MAG: substrate-binding domain-containing protein [Candidatus Limnocylindrales bacterium]
MFNRKFATLVAAGAIALAACSSSSTPSPAASSGGGGGGGASAAPSIVSAAGCTVGVSWNNYQEERWAKWDEPAIKAGLAAAGAKYISNDAKSSAETQATNVTNLISQGAKVLIILAQDGTAIKTSVAAANQAGIPVIAYDRLIEDPSVFYLTFDNKLVGKLQAQSVLAVQPKGNFAIIKGNKADANADFLRAGMTEAGIPDVGQSSADIKIVGETYTDNWDGSKAQTEMQQILTANNNKVDAVLSENDGMATGVAAALAAQGLKVPLSGQDGDKAALNRIALGTQTVSVWKDSRLLGTAAAQVAAQLCNGTKVDAIAGASKFTTPGNNTLNAIQLQPDPITNKNLNDVLSAGWIAKADLCQGVTAGSVAGC